MEWSLCYIPNLTGLLSRAGEIIIRNVSVQHVGPWYL